MKSYIMWYTIKIAKNDGSDHDNWSPIAETKHLVAWQSRGVVASQEEKAA